MAWNQPEGEKRTSPLAHRPTPVPRDELVAPPSQGLE